MSTGGVARACGASSHVWLQPERLIKALLQRALARVIVKLDLSPPETTYYAPAMTLCKLAHLRLGHFPQNSKLNGLGDHVLGPG